MINAGIFSGDIVLADYDQEKTIQLDDNITVYSKKNLENILLCLLFDLLNIKVIIFRIVNNV